MKKRNRKPKCLNSANKITKLCVQLVEQSGCKIWFLDLLQILQARGTISNTNAGQIPTPDQVQVLKIRTSFTKMSKSFISQCGVSKFQVLQLMHVSPNRIRINVS